MRRDQLEHIIRAAAAASGDSNIVVLGSQAILGSYADPPEALTFSAEADVYPRSNRERADNIDGTLGELSRFHETHRVYAQVVGPETATAPDGWEDRLVPLHNENTGGATGWCMEPHDLVLAKLARGERKDREFAHAAVGFGLVNPGLLVRRAATLPARVRERATDALFQTFGQIEQATGATLPTRTAHPTQPAVERRPDSARHANLAGRCGSTLTKTGRPCMRRVKTRPCPHHG